MTKSDGVTAPRSIPAASAVGVALCASFTTTLAYAAPVAVNVPDTLLGTFNLNINGGAPEYVFGWSQSSIPPVFAADENRVDAQGVNQVLGFIVPPPIEGDIPTTKPGTYANALNSGDSIDAAGFVSDGVSGTGIILSGESFFIKDTKTYGEFFDRAGFSYVGLRFDLGDGPRHGWVETTNDGLDLTITRFGYECDINAPIAAGAGTEGATCSLPPPGTGVPEPGTLALLVAGAVGVAALRRRQRARC